MPLLLFLTAVSYRWTCHSGAWSNSQTYRNLVLSTKTDTSFRQIHEPTEQNPNTKMNFPENPSKIFPCKCKVGSLEKKTISKSSRNVSRKDGKQRIWTRFSCYASTKPAHSHLKPQNQGRVTQSLKRQIWTKNPMSFPLNSSRNSFDPKEGYQWWKKGLWAHTSERLWSLDASNITCALLHCVHAEHPFTHAAW